MKLVAEYQDGIGFKFVFSLHVCVTKNLSVVCETSPIYMPCKHNVMYWIFITCGGVRICEESHVGHPTLSVSQV